MAATVSPDHILKELSELWVGLGKQGQQEGGAGVLRACSMTLVVLAEETDDPMALGETIAALMPEHPARAILVRMRGGSEPALSERVYSQCWMPFGQRRQICCEQIELAASDASLSDLPSVILPLAVPDLPLIVWCRAGRLFDVSGFPGIAGMARKVVLDSGAVAEPSAAIRRIMAFHRSGILLGDLSWTRLTRWRETLSQVFENHVYLALLPNIRTVHVEGGKGFEVTAQYMGHWAMNAMADAGIHPQLQVSGAPDGISLRMELAGEGLQVELLRDRERLRTTVNGLSNCTNLPQPSDYLLMREELSIIHPDPVFARTLASAAAASYSTDK